MHLSTYLELLHEAERSLATSYRVVGDGHAPEADLHTTCGLLASQCDRHVTALAPVLRRYERSTQDRPERLHPTAGPSWPQCETMPGMLRCRRNCGDAPTG